MLGAQFPFCDIHSLDIIFVTNQNELTLVTIDQQRIRSFIRKFTPYNSHSLIDLGTIPPLQYNKLHSVCNKDQRVSPISNVLFWIKFVLNVVLSCDLKFHPIDRKFTYLLDLNALVQVLMILITETLI